MPLDRPLTATAQERLKQVREQIDAALESLVADMVALATAERDTAVSEVQTQAEAAVAKARSESEGVAAERLAVAQAQTAEAEERARTASAERTEVEKRLAETSTDTRVEERQCDLACLERLVDGVRDLDTATTLSQVLDKLADHAALQVARVAILIVRDRELRGWRLQGFGENADPATIALSLDSATVVREAVETRTKATTVNGGGNAREPLPFATLPAERVGLALPLTVGVRTVAVLYADEGPGGEVTVPSGWPEVLETLARHAAARLELLTMARAYGLHAQPFDAPRADTAASVAAGRQAGAAATEDDTLNNVSGHAAGQPPSIAADKPGDVQSRQASEEDASALRYARLLISEIKLYHEDAVNEGRRDANLLARLGPEIARARRLYEERVPAEVRNRADHFGQELVRTLANGDPRLLGQAT